MADEVSRCHSCQRGLDAVAAAAVRALVAGGKPGISQSRLREWRLAQIREWRTMEMKASGSTDGFGEDLDALTDDGLGWLFEQCDEPTKAPRLPVDEAEVRADIERDERGGSR